MGEEYEASHSAPITAEAQIPQGDLYNERAQQPIAPQQPQTAIEPELEIDHHDRDQRRNGWSLFGKPKSRPHSNYVAPQADPQPTQQLRQTSQVAPEDDLEIPSFLRRLAN